MKTRVQMLVRVHVRAMQPLFSAFTSVLTKYSIRPFKGSRFLILGASAFSWRLIFSVRPLLLKGFQPTSVVFSR